LFPYFAINCVHRGLPAEWADKPKPKRADL
jgi:hypothetical protein